MRSVTSAPRQPWRPGGLSSARSSRPSATVHHPSSGRATSTFTTGSSARLVVGTGDLSLPQSAENPRDHPSCARSGRQAGWIARNPAERATPPRAPRRGSSHPRLKRSASWSRSPPVTTHRRRRSLAAVTGARRSELLALRWADLDLDRGVVEVARGVVIGRAGVVEKETERTRPGESPLTSPPCRLWLLSGTEPLPRRRRAGPPCFQRHTSSAPNQTQADQSGPTSSHIHSCDFELAQASQVCTFTTSATS
jgi:hypothetical protein